MPAAGAGDGARVLSGCSQITAHSSGQSPGVWESGKNNISKELIFLEMCLKV